MTKRNIAWIALAVLTIISAAGIIFGPQSVRDVMVTQVEIQEVVNDTLPLGKNNFTITSMGVRFTDGELILTPKAEGRKFGQDFAVSATAKGVPRYDMQKGSFYFSPHSIEITSLTMKGEAVSEKVEKFIDRFVNSPKINQNKAAIGAKVEEFVHASMEDAMSWTLHKMPFYTLPHSMKGNIFRLLIRSVEIENGKLTLHLSVWQLTKLVLFYIVAFMIAIGIAIALVMNPGWGIELFLLTV
jgi:hypothetical protein